jgi:hypothetical protein
MLLPSMRAASETHPQESYGCEFPRGTQTMILARLMGAQLATALCRVVIAVS